MNKSQKRILSNAPILTIALITILLLMSLSLSSLFSSVNVQNELKDYLSNIYPGQPYREPTSDESSSFLNDFQSLLDGNTKDLKNLPNLGYQIKEGTDTISGKQYVLIINEKGTDRAWGAYLVDPAQPIHYVITAPHPRADMNTEHIAFELWQKTPSSMLMIAGAHRTSANNLADVAHAPDSLFNKVSDYLASKNIKHIQLHGFANETAPGKDIIISPGQASVDPLMKRVASAIKQKGLKVGASWDEDTDMLLAKSNVQGKFAHDHQAFFMHIEMNNSVRISEEAIHKVTDSIASELTKENK